MDQKLSTFIHAHGIVYHNPAQTQVINTGIQNNVNALASSESAHPTSNGTLLNAIANAISNYLVKTVNGGLKNFANANLAATLINAELMNFLIQTHANVLVFQLAAKKAKYLTKETASARKMDAIGGMKTTKIKNKQLLLALLLLKKTTFSVTVIANASAQFKIATEAFQTLLIVIAVVFTGSKMDQINKMQIMLVLQTTWAIQIISSIKAFVDANASRKIMKFAFKKMETILISSGIQLTVLANAKNLMILHAHQ
jgi:hypothetical protein